ncbi:AAA family ATPase [Acinetobacter rudis]|uniref:AAA family ATPase n=1 Tax=Acinetobacter rudis TaxID=632955 RepID=UPI0028105FAB|nr:AAA family ATPase [Acinetobacter rudis]MDQ8953040.1 AAA family ATPase [Acinetobacter rudis]
MKLNSIQLKQTYCFQHIKIDFQHNQYPITAFIGTQASGKTAILKNIYHALSWFPARFKDLRTSGIVMPDQDIRHDATYSKIDICIEIPNEIGQLPESSNAKSNSLNQCQWQLFKVLRQDGLGVSKVECTQLEQCITLYHHALKQDPLQGMPLIAYYPSARFVNEISLMSKNTPNIWQTHSGYELTALTVTTFSRFFEWLRESSDIENAQSTYLLQQLLNIPQIEGQTENQLEQKIMQLRSQQHSSSLFILKNALNQIFPELTDIYLEYYPKLQLVVCYQQQTLNYLQLSSSLKIWIALIGDVVRRLCLLNPMSITPCQEGEGILIIDQIDAELDPEFCSIILDRLHTTFPQLQIIVSAQHQAILENSAYFQYFNLNKNGISEIPRQKIWQEHQHYYDQIIQEELSSVEVEQLNNQDELSKAQEIFDQIQKLNHQQQAELQRLLQADDDCSTEISTY